MYLRRHVAQSIIPHKYFDGALFEKDLADIKCVNKVRAKSTVLSNVAKLFIFTLDTDYRNRVDVKSGIGIPESN